MAKQQVDSGVFIEEVKLAKTADKVQAKYEEERDKPEEFVAAPEEKVVVLHINLAGSFNSYEHLWKACEDLADLAGEYEMSIISTSTYSEVIGGDN